MGFGFVCLLIFQTGTLWVAGIFFGQARPLYAHFGH